MVDIRDKLPTLGLLCLDAQSCSMGTDAFSDNKLWTLYTWDLQMEERLKGGKMLENSHLNVWITNPYDDVRTYCIRTSIPLIVFEDEKAQIILRETVAKTGQSDLKDLLHDNIQIVVRYVKVGRRDLWENGIPYFTFGKCTIIRTWIPNLVVSQAYDANVVEHFAEIESYQYSWKTAEEKDE